MCYCPTPTLHLNLALTGDCAFQLSPQKTHSVWFISVLKSGDMGQCPEKSPSPCNTCVIPVSLYKSMSWFVTKTHTQTHTHTHTHTLTHTHRHRHTHTLSHTLSLTHTHTHSLTHRHTHTLSHTHTHTDTDTHTHTLSHTHTYTHTLSHTHTHTHWPLQRSLTCISLSCESPWASVIHVVCAAGLEVAPKFKKRCQNMPLPNARLS